jgi:hypothetical protein
VEEEGTPVTTVVTTVPSTEVTTADVVTARLEVEDTPVVEEVDEVAEVLDVEDA